LSDLLTTQPLWFLFLSLSVLGAIWGSFVAALCGRWPTGESIARGRSRCDHCLQRIAFYDLIPLVSYVLLKGKCRNCNQAIGPRPFATELAGSAIGAIPVLLLPADQAVAAAMFGWLMLPLFLLDHGYLWLPNRLVLPLAVTGFLIGPMLLPAAALEDRFAGLAAGFLSLEIIRRAYKYIRKQDGMGAGDPKLLGALGIWLGWQLLPFVLLGASVVGLITAINARVPIPSRPAFPFGSYLCIAAYLVVMTL
jgi:leader peptidase (prepilin peptidase) / N-methyltransferase